MEQIGGRHQRGFTLTDTFILLLRLFSLLPRAHKTLVGIHSAHTELSMSASSF